MQSKGFIFSPKLRYYSYFEGDAFFSPLDVKLFSLQSAAPPSRFAWQRLNSTPPPRHSCQGASFFRYLWDPSREKVRRFDSPPEPWWLDFGWICPRSKSRWASSNWWSGWVLQIFWRPVCSPFWCAWGWEGSGPRFYYVFGVLYIK